MPNNHPSTNQAAVVEWLIFLALVIGSANWALVGLFDLDVIDLLFGHRSFLARASYTVLGATGIYCLIRALAPATGNQQQQSAPAKKSGALALR